MNVGSFTTSVQVLVPIEVTTAGSDPKPAAVDPKKGVSYSIPNGENLVTTPATVDEMAPFAIPSGYAVWLHTPGDAALGEVVVALAADADLGDGDEPINGSFSVTVEAQHASNLGASAILASRPKPVAVP